MAAINRTSNPTSGSFGSLDLGKKNQGQTLATVQTGESTLAEVARRLGCSVEALALANPQIGASSPLKAGQDIRVPAQPDLLETPASPPSNTLAAEQSTESAPVHDPLAKLMAQIQLRDRRALPAFHANGGNNNVPQPGGLPGALFWKKGGPQGTNAVRSTAKSALAAGTKLGVNGDGSAVAVKRQVGSADGYKSRWQAMAVARLGNAEPAAVVNIGGKWHAVETDRAVDAKFKSGDASRTTHAVASQRDITQAADTVKALQRRLSELKDMKQTKAVSEETSDVIQKLAAANLRRASLVLGVPESDIKFKINTEGREPGVINIVPGNDVNAPSGSHGPMWGQGSDTFTKDLKSVFDVKYATLDNPAWAQLTLFHELEHENDWQMAQDWVKLYEAGTGRMFMREGLHLFKQWMDDQAKAKPPKISKADADLVVDVAGNFKGMTEARANIRQTLLAYQVGQPDLAAKALNTYAWALTPKSKGGGGIYPTPHPKSEFMLGLYEEIRTAYRQMPKAMQTRFVEALEAVKAKYPGAWVSDFKLK